jgi:HAD superfamily hydrolase (TIGR01509 family)
LRHRGGNIYRAVFFDAFNTLFGLRWSRNSGKRSFPAQRTVRTVVHRFDANLQAAYGRAKASQPGESSPVTRFFAELADRTGLATTGPLALLHRSETAVRRWFNVYADVLSTLQILQQSCSLGIISNAWPYLEGLLNLLGLTQYFDSLTISAQVGLIKPNPAIFQLALRSLHIAAHEAIFVDDLPENVIAAETMGLRSLWLVRAPLAPQRIALVHRELDQIQSLEQVIPLLHGA